ncbi:hypothetical protein BDY24DRAFT_404094 [Mrakia frigida]|uniref:uncharacterized protein n=1 Tax=Mrakia frigida TaxID=29902 RepID=UPI003FCC0819
MSARSCGTCAKPVYPKEKIGISDIWFHTACLKCSVCSSTLSLNSVYVSVASGEKKIYCKVDVPRAIHTAVVDSIALRRALTAPKPDNPGPKALRTGSMRFKGLTLRSKGMRGGMEGPKLNVVAGTGQVSLSATRRDETRADRKN